MNIDKREHLFEGINGFFDHIYLITLKKSDDRHLYVETTLKGLNYDIFWGVDGADLDIDEVIENGLYDPDLAETKYPVGQKLVPGEIGCALSHLSIYRDILKNGYQRVLILEDDVTVDPDCLPDVESTFAELPKDWDLLYLGCRDNHNKITVPATIRVWIIYPILRFLGFKDYDRKRLRNTYPRPHSKHLELAGWHFGTYAYGVTAQGAKKILESQTPISLAADNAIGMACIDESIKAFRIRQKAFRACAEFASTIEGRIRSKP